MSDDKIDRHIDKVTLTNLFNSDMVAQRAAAEERGAIASRIKGLQESHGLDTTAYRLAKSIAKLPDGKREATYRAVLLYCDHLEVCKQGELDLDAKVQANAARTGGRTEQEALMDGEERGSGTVESAAEKNAKSQGATVTSILRPNTPPARAALDAFKASQAEATTAKAANEGLDRFTKDHPYLADAARDITLARLSDIDIAASDGEEDLRPDHLKNAAKKEAEEIAKANLDAAKARPGKARGDRKPRAKAAGGAGAAVH